MRTAATVQRNPPVPQPRAHRLREPAGRRHRARLRAGHPRPGGPGGLPEPVRPVRPRMASPGRRELQPRNGPPGRSDPHLTARTSEHEHLCCQFPARSGRRRSGKRPARTSGTRSALRASSRTARSRCAGWATRSPSGATSRQSARAGRPLPAPRRAAVAGREPGRPAGLPLPWRGSALRRHGHTRAGSPGCKLEGSRRRAASTCTEANGAVFLYNATDPHWSNAAAAAPARSR
jgi:hypothetical protein